LGGVGSAEHRIDLLAIDPVQHAVPEHGTSGHLRMIVPQSRKINAS
jgi:hypothetical protein